MRKFDLSLWLQDKSRKVVTRDGRPVRIICSDRKAKSGNIVGLVEEDESLIYVWDNNGNHIVSGFDKNDLFFADEEEKPQSKELTEFEDKLLSFALMFSANIEEEKIEYVKESAKILLDLARKEILKDLPKWKKVNVFVSNEFGLATRDDDLIITHNGYQIKLSDLETLPKEE